MSKIPLIIDAGYCERWGAWEGCRELISNAKDAEELDPRHTMEIHHSKRTSRLTICTKDVVVDPATLLVLGKSSKRGREVRGRFGEGFVIGCLALTRAGHPITFRNHDLSWKCVFEIADSDHPLAGNELLTFYSRGITPTADFELTIENITEEVWEAMLPLFLFMTPPPPQDVVKVDQGSLILTPERKGMVFARGVFVRKFHDLHCGYDLRDVELDRDRQMIDEWKLGSTLSDLWGSVLSGRKDVQHAQESLAQRAYDMVKEGTDEARHFRYRTDDRLVNAMKARFVAEHGEDVIPVSSMDEAKEIEGLGAKPVVVNSTLKELLAKTGLSAETAKASLEGKVTARLLPSQLTDVERAVLNVVDVLIKGYVVVEFRGPAACRMIDDDMLLAIDRRILTLAPEDILRKVASVEGKRRNVDTSTVLAEALARFVKPKTAEQALVDNYYEGLLTGHLSAGPSTREGYDACDECGNEIPDTDGWPHMENPHHKGSCSLYPHADGAEAKPH